MLLQELWIVALGWDDPLPQELSEKWDNYCERLPDLQGISIPRWNTLASDEVKCELHGFADASTRAYAAVVYLRTITDEGETKISLLAARTKVAPIKTISVPRLELCAAVLLTKLMTYVSNAMQLKRVTKYAWTDSTVVLAWIRRHPSEWPTFVANRVATIQYTLPEVPWKHVPTTQNPADCASRGLVASELLEQPLWWQGPPWLKLSQAKWPRDPPSLTKKTLGETAAPTKTHLAVDRLLHWELCSDISSWGKLTRITAYCRRFTDQCKHRTNAQELRLTGSEITAAQTFWINDTQRAKFSSEIHAIQQGSPLPRNSQLRKLTPFLDEKGTLRVGGRLEQAEVPFEEKHPAILPQHRVTQLIVEDAHVRCLHGGPQLMISIIRQKYWILEHRTFVRNLIQKCVPCVRERARTPCQLMGNLPKARVSQHRAFLHTGLDYAGPFLVRTSKGRGHKAHKAYLALFVCMSTRAVHLELVSDYTTDAFFAACRRFIARRGLPSDIYSDNGTTFQGAERELQNAFKAAISDTDLGNLIAMDRTSWHFIPPGAPHFGGLWEAGVKCTKHHLKRVLRTQTLTYEEFNTLVTQVEACLNSRPIGPNLTDTCEFAALTPGHLLIGAPLLAVPEPSLLQLNENRLSRWQLIQRTLESFWKRWSVEYLHSLQVRTKWKTEQVNLAARNLVLIRHNNLPPAKWLLGRVVEVHPGSDHRVRVVTIRTAQSTLKRPISQICVLPVDSAVPDSPPPSPSDSHDTTDFHEFLDCDSVDDSSPTEGV